MPTIVLPDSIPVPRCSACHANPVAYLTIEIEGGEVRAVCLACDHPRSARLAEFAVLTRTLETKP